MQPLRQARTADDEAPFLAGGGEMGALIRAHDWAATPLGPPARWPAGLRTALRLLLTTPQAAFVFWGPERRCFCNDAGRRSLASGDAAAPLGERGATVWPEAWVEVGPRIERVASGHGEDRREEHPTYSLSAIDDENAPAGIGGVLLLMQAAGEQQAAQQALGASERRLRIASDAAAIGIYELDVESGRVSWDARTREIWGAGDRQSVSMAEMNAAVHPQDRTLKSAATARALDPRGDGHYRTEYRVVSAADGRTRWVLAQGQAVFEGGRATRLVGAVQDISERKLADSRRDEFLATLGHELRNPLAPIGNALQMLQRQGGHGEVADSAIAVIDRQFRQVVRLIDDLLDIVRISHGRFELRRARVGLHQVIEQALETAAPAIERGSHRIDRRLPDAPVWLDVDAARIAQVLSNLVINACKYSDAGSTIDIVAERCGDAELALRVRDRGIGIDPADLERIFETFSQAEPSLQRSQGGLGIGLSLSRGIVELHGGRISARSAGRNLGSVFEIVLPLARQRVDSASRVAAAPRTPVPETAGDPQADDRLAGMRLLLVEDNHDHAETLSVLLGLYGALVRWAPDGVSALAAAMEQKPQTVLLDLGLPGLNGYEVCRRLRATAWGKTIQIIALTGWGQPSDRERTRRAGFDAHLLKPVDFDALLRLLSP